jgi:hypothetical protein
MSPASPVNLSLQEQMSCKQAHRIHERVGFLGSREPQQLFGGRVGWNWGFGNFRLSGVEKGNDADGTLCDPPGQV